MIGFIINHCIGCIDNKLHKSMKTLFESIYVSLWKLTTMNMLRWFGYYVRKNWYILDVTSISPLLIMV